MLDNMPDEETDPLDMDTEDGWSWMEYILTDWFMFCRLETRNCTVCDDHMQARTRPFPRDVKSGMARYSSTMKALPRGWRRDPRVIAFLKDLDRQLREAGDDLMKAPFSRQWAGETAPPYPAARVPLEAHKLAGI